MPENYLTVTQARQRWKGKLSQTYEWKLWFSKLLKLIILWIIFSIISGQYKLNGAIFYI